MRYQPAIRHYRPHCLAVWNLCTVMAGLTGGERVRGPGTVVRPGEELGQGMQFNIPTGCVAVWDGGWSIVEDKAEVIVPIIVRSILGGSLVPDAFNDGIVSMYASDIFA